MDRPTEPQGVGCYNARYREERVFTTSSSTYVKGDRVIKAQSGNKVICFYKIKAWAFSEFMNHSNDKFCFKKAN